MEIHGRRVLLLGGAGLVGTAVCRQMLNHGPEELIVSSLKEHEAMQAQSELSRAFPETKITPVWGNMFVREEHKDLPPSSIIEDPKLRDQLISDNLDDLTDAILKNSFLYQIISRHKPDIVVDCVNSATAVAYQDIFLANYKVRESMKELRSGGGSQEKMFTEVEKLLATLYVPQLIRHVQILNESMRQAKTTIYLKVGTSGTGGLGLNIPYTHSEEKPSRMLLSKSSVAGAHTLLLFLMARTPGGAIIKEIKPTAAIAWKKIAYGEVQRKGGPVELFDCDPAFANPIGSSLPAGGYQEYQSTGENMKTVFIDTGENGIFSTGEFEAISSSGQMELITPEEIARNVIFEIRGGNTGHDVINALDYAAMGPSYRAGVMRGTALEKLKELEEEFDCDSVSFTLIGPFVSKLLFEAFVIKKVCKDLTELKSLSARELMQRMESLIRNNIKARTSILSVGIGILMPDGKTLLHGPELTVPPFKGKRELDVNDESINQWSKDGWVDLRLSNAEVWKGRCERIFAQMDSIPDDDTSSQYIRNENYWLKDKSINIGKIVGWILAVEEHSARLKR
ncbi:MAG: polysaccharide biosynthesis protein [bacterium]|nr:polysaccharide biosynthesis protein [bacterium]